MKTLVADLEESARLASPLREMQEKILNQSAKVQSWAAHFLIQGERKDANRVVEEDMREKASVYETRGVQA